MIIISGYFGLKCRGIYPAPIKTKSFFFSNNLLLKKIAESQGWKFIYLNKYSLTTNYRISSLQSKYIKFLQFDFDELGISSDEGILYFDHKLYVKKEHIFDVIKLCDTDLLIRESPGNKSIQDEINEATLHPRYKFGMIKTIDWLSQKINNKAYLEANKLALTGFIYYKSPRKFMSLTKEVFDVCNQLNQPECQIIWAVLSEPYNNFITQVDAQKINPVWKKSRAGFNLIDSFSEILLYAFIWLLEKIKIRN
ncbi:hypothetical protein N9539_04205 [Amylibacter sp.]|nr:hypothetical protein [Amylibacter sp.]